MKKGPGDMQDYDYEGDMSFYQDQLERKGITKAMLDMDRFIGLTDRELQNIVDSVRIEEEEDEIGGENAAEIIRKILKAEGVSQQELADRMGVFRQSISQMLNRESASMRFSSFQNLIKTLGYEIIVRKKENARL